jgi:hypothetical protein
MFQARDKILKVEVDLDSLQIWCVGNCVEKADSNCNGSLIVHMNNPSHFFPVEFQNLVPVIEGEQH